MAETRRGTRINYKLAFTLSSLDRENRFSGPSLTILVNPQGCAAKFNRPLAVGALVRLDGLPVERDVTARVVNCISLRDEKFWIIGLALDDPGNVWGVEAPPADWAQSTLPSVANIEPDGASLNRAGRFSNLFRWASLGLRVLSK